ncbi:TIGR03790 family protein [Thauera sinica]|uniref:TIGR03790 family protein n=1 Tax=Thauera sinica TaxID=2665146 RepID=A0ABW1ANL4_9RHOO|nr:TIGR03790 family protein [Thauera sp. K11]ATE60516.1 TIGR03790 family protein [Thauera sp. K11]
MPAARPLVRNGRPRRAGRCLSRPLLRVLLLLALAAGPVRSAPAAPHLSFSQGALGAGELALVINQQDPYSVEVGRYYAAVRKIPERNIVRVAFEPGPNLPRAEFERIRAQVEAALPASVQAYALAWTRPWRVDCMSVTSAFAFGFDPAFCSSSQCAPTRPNPLFDRWTATPYDDTGVRPAMLLAASSPGEARRMIDRGAAAEGAHPVGTAYLVRTGDPARNTRAVYFGATAEALGERLPVRVIEGEGIGRRRDAMFYFTGTPRVAEIDGAAGEDRRPRLLPGALADHLTSFGGVLEGSSQMSALAWLAAGASASYGTVVEPCSHPQKFPAPAVAMSHYLAGATALEAYWRSVAWPGEGVFIGDPLARPFAPIATALGDDALRVTLNAPSKGHLVLFGAPSAVGPYRPASPVIPLKPGRNQVVLRHLGDAFYRAALVADSMPR